MWMRLATLASLALLLAGGDALAGEPKPDYGSLKSMLEKKYAPKPEEGTSTTSPKPSPEPSASEAPPATEGTPAEADKKSENGGPPQGVRRKWSPEERERWLQRKAKREDFDWVNIDPEARKKWRERRKALRERSTTEKTGSWINQWMEKAKSAIWGKEPSSFIAPFGLPYAGANIIGLPPTAATSGGGEDLVVLTGGAAAQSELPIAKRNSFIIQLKPNTSEAQVDALLRKYDLTVTNVIGDLGVLTVQQNSPSAPADTSSDPKKRLQSILEPPVLKQIRKEPIVDAAFVNTVVTPKAHRRGLGASAKSGETTFEWRWRPGDTPDGNWGLKTMRVPAVWTVLENFRRTHPDAPKPKIGIIDVGFTESPHVKLNVAIGGYRPPLIRPDCETNHGTHVAGIIGAVQGAAPGIEGIVPGADIDAVAIGAEFIGEREKLGADESWQAQAMLFSDVLANTMIYLTQNLRAGSNLRVVNVSLAYNFVARGVLGDADPDEVEGLKLHIAEQASVIRTMARLVEDEVLLVVAAGNDSEGLEGPLDTKWASPLAWAGTYEWTSGPPVTNILVVEATDRDGKRAPFSNVGGHVAAPGVDIMSTLGGQPVPFGVCSGTSQAAPHVAALAAILFELDPSRRPSDVIELLKSNALPSATLDAEGKPLSAPRVDALSTVLAATEAAPRLLADLDQNGKVDADDLAIYTRQLNEIDMAAATAAPFTTDLNGDGVVDDNECFYPLIDLNGDGQGSIRQASADRTGAWRSDLAVLERAWQGSADDLKTAMVTTGLSARVASTMVAAAGEEDVRPVTACRRQDPTVMAELGTGLTPSAPEPSAPAAALTPSAAEGGGAPAPAAPTVVAQASDQATSAEIRDEVAKGLDQLRKDNPELKVTINPATGLPLSISGFKPDASSLAAGARPAGDQTEEETKRMVETFLASESLSAALPTKNKQAELAYVGRRRDPDFPGRYIANVEQRVNGIPVFGSSAKVTVETALGVTRFQGSTSTVAITDTEPTVSREDAIAAGRARLKELIQGSPTSPAPPLHIGPNPETAAASATLTIFDPALIKTRAKGVTRLAWLVSIDSYRIFIDAKTGESFHFYLDKPTGLIRRIYDLGQADAPALVDEESRKTAQSLPDDAKLAFRYSGAVRDFFFLVFGRNGFDDNDGDGPKGGAPLDSYIRYGNVKNAFWCPSKSYDCPKPNVMVFGPGYAGAVDIVAHEMVHGVIAHEANLVYSDEPGAVNEGIADIFAVLIESFARGSSGNWLIGEEAPGFSLERPLRSLANPNLTDETHTSSFNKNANYSSANRGQPDHYEDIVTPDDRICASTWLNDNGCVHFNSGILNKFAYLLSEGGVHGGMTVNGIGKMKLARLTYRTLTTHLNATSGLLQTVDGYLQSCLDLSSGDIAGFTEEDCNQVLAARQAVGLSFGS